MCLTLNFFLGCFRQSWGPWERCKSGGMSRWRVAWGPKRGLMDVITINENRADGPAGSLGGDLRP